MKKRRYVGGFGVGEEYLCLVSQLGIFQKIKKSKISKFQKRNMLKLIEALFRNGGGLTYFLFFSRRGRKFS
jgi:hypothetical protein